MEIWLILFSIFMVGTKVKLVKLTRVERASIDGFVPLRPDEVKLALVAKGTPFRVDDHVARTVIV
jgi:hypothetical protein